MSERIIWAGEIAQYLYCARAWWLVQTQRLGPVNVEELSRGNEFHAAHGRAVASSAKSRRMSVIPVELAALCLVAALPLRGGEP